MIAQSNWATSPLLTADSAPFATRANLGSPKVGCQIIDLPAGMPTPPDGSPKIVHTWLPAGVAVVTELHLHPDVPQTDILAKGRWHRWALLIPKHTLDALGPTRFAQIKLFYSRVGAPVNHFTILGVGSAFHSNDNRIAVQIDQFNAPIGLGPVITPDVWHQVEVFEMRTPGVGHTVVKWDGMQIANASNPLLGDDDPTSKRGAAWNCYSEHSLPGGVLDLFCGNISITES